MDIRIHVYCVILAREFYFYPFTLEISIKDDAGGLKGTMILCSIAIKSYFMSYRDCKMDDDLVKIIL